MKINLDYTRATIKPKEGLIQSAHQPNFLPWIGYFAKMNQSHVFVFSDDVRFSKQQPTTRTNLAGLSKRSFAWILPVNRLPVGRLFEKSLNKDERRLFDRGLARAKSDYRGAPYYGDMRRVFDKIEELYQAHNLLANFNVACIVFIAELFRIEFLPLLGSELGLQFYSANERLLRRADLLGIPHYLCGQGSAGYQDDDFLISRGLKLTYANYSEINNDFGMDSAYSVLHLIGLYGVERIREHFSSSAYRSEGVARFE